MHFLTLGVLFIVIAIYAFVQGRPQDGEDGHQIHEVVGQIIQRGNAQRTGDKHTRGAPGNDRAEGQGTVRDGTGHDTLINAQLLIPLAEGLDGDESRHIGIAEHIAAQSGYDSRAGYQPRLVTHQERDLLHDAGQQASTLEQAGHSQRDNHQHQSGGHCQHTAAVADGSHRHDVGLDRAAVHHHIQGITKAAALIQPRGQGSDDGSQSQGGHRGDLQDQHDNQGHHRDQGGQAQLEGLSQPAGDLCHSAHIHVLTAVPHAEDSEDNEGHNKCGSGRPQHPASVLVDINLGHTGGENAEVGQRRLLVAEESAAADRAGGDSDRDAQAHGDADESNTNGGGGGPGGARHRGHDRTHDGHKGQENHVKYGDFIYSEGSDSSLWVNLFIPSQLNWTDRKMIVTQDTDIPSSDKTVLTVKTEKPQSVIFRLRYPEWAESMRIKVNGSSVSFEASNNSYVSIEREWKDNDKIEITFKIKFYTVSMPDNEKRVGIFYGPVLLAGELGTEEPDMEKDIPVLVTNNQPVDKWLEKVSDSPLRFKTKGVGEPKDMSLIPFYGMHHQHYMVYWDLFTTEEWKDMQEAYKNELKRLQDLDKITVDYVTLGEMQPERDHNFRGEGIGNGVSHRKKWRAAWIGGWFEFDMKVLPDVPQDLHVTYWGGETAHLEFDIYVDGKVLARQHLYQNKQNQFFEGVYSLPEHFWKGKEKITIRFKGVPGNWTGAIYNARIAKHE